MTRNLSDGCIAEGQELYDCPESIVEIGTRAPKGVE
jgi:hypothetical protein